MKIIFSTAFFLLTFNFLSGQVLQSIGIRNGVSISNQDWLLKSSNIQLPTDPYYGVYTGLTMDFLQSKYFNITTDIGYVRKGHIQKFENSTEDMPEGDGTYSNRGTAFDFLTFSPLLRVKYEMKQWTPYALFGFRLDYMLSYTSDLNLQDIENDFNKTIWGWTSGIGLEYRVRTFGYTIEVQNHQDFSKLLEKPSSVTSDGLSIFNRAWIMSFGVKYYF
jgi:hypothetical protein